MVRLAQDPPRLLVTGASGYLGRHLVARAVGWDVHGTYFSQVPSPAALGTPHALDLRDADATAALLADLAPTVVIHTACANRTAEHIAAIEPAARAIAAAARSMGARLLHLSTDSVLQGAPAPYDESAPALAASPYGGAKARAEGIVAALCPGALIVRTSLICGLDPPDHQTRWLLDAVASGAPATLFTDEIRCPIWVESLADALLELATLDLAGVLNVAGDPPMDRWALGQAMLGRLGVALPPHVVPGLRPAGSERGPADLRLDLRRARALLATPLRGPGEAPPG